MSSREIERLEAEAAAQRRQLSKSWEDLQDAVSLAPRRSKRLRSPAPIREGSARLLVDLCLLAVTIGCVVELYRRTQANRDTGAPWSVPRVTTGVGIWKTPPRTKRKIALPKRNVRLLKHQGLALLPGPTGPQRLH